MIGSTPKEKLACTINISCSFALEMMYVVGGSSSRRIPTCRSRNDSVLAGLKLCKAARSHNLVERRALT